MAAEHQHSISLSLPQFWSENAAGWFAHAEARFRGKRVYDEWDRFDLTVAALSKEMVQLNVHTITNPDEDEPYTQLKTSLLQQHTLTSYQRIERLLAMDALGSRKPTQLLAEMLELCPDEEEDSMFFTFLFLQRLPSWLRIMLETDEQTEIHQLAVKADRLVALHGHQQVGTVAVVEEPSAVNAVRQGTTSRRGGKSSGRGGKTKTSNPAATAAEETAPSDLARNSAGLCYFHWAYGDKARKCTKPCSWQGN